MSPSWVDTVGLTFDLPDRQGSSRGHQFKRRPARPGAAWSGGPRQTKPEPCARWVPEALGQGGVGPAGPFRWASRRWSFSECLIDILQLREASVLLGSGVQVRASPAGAGDWGSSAGDCDGSHCNMKPC